MFATSIKRHVAGLDQLRVGRRPGQRDRPGCRSAGSPAPRVGPPNFSIQFVFRLVGDVLGQVACGVMIATDGTAAPARVDRSYSSSMATRSRVSTVLLDDPDAPHRVEPVRAAADVDHVVGGSFWPEIGSTARLTDSAGDPRTMYTHDAGSHCTASGQPSAPRDVTMRDGVAVSR